MVDLQEPVEEPNDYVGAPTANPLQLSPKRKLEEHGNENKFQQLPSGEPCFKLWHSSSSGTANTTSANIDSD